MEAAALLLEELTFLVQEIMQYVCGKQLEKKRGQHVPCGRADVWTIIAAIASGLKPSLGRRLRWSFYNATNKPFGKAWVPV